MNGRAGAGEPLKVVLLIELTNTVLLSSCRVPSTVAVMVPALEV